MLRLARLELMHPVMDVEVVGGQKVPVRRRRRGFALPTNGNNGWETEIPTGGLVTVWHHRGASDHPARIPVVNSRCARSPCVKMVSQSGCGAAWLARLLGVQEVPSSNLGSPTKFLKELQRPTTPGPLAGVQPGVQKWTPAALCGRRGLARYLTFSRRFFVATVDD